jgi:predicted RNase H-like HicB family nuclease
MTGTVEIAETIGQETNTREAKWTNFENNRAYQCRVAIVEEPTGGYSAHARNLPGAVSQGESVEKALENIAEACQGVLEEYTAMGHIPWSEVEIEGKVVAEKRILVHV